MTIREEVVEILKKKAAALFGVDASALDENTRFIEDLACKSVDMVQLCSVLENEFEVEIPYAAFEDIKTFGDAGDFIDRSLGI